GSIAASRPRSRRCPSGRSLLTARSRRPSWSRARWPCCSCVTPTTPPWPAAAADLPPVARLEVDGADHLVRDRSPWPLPQPGADQLDLVRSPLRSRVDSERPGKRTQVQLAGTAAGPGDGQVGSRRPLLLRLGQRRP